MRLLPLLLLAGLRLGAQNIIQYTPAYGPAFGVVALPDNSLLVQGAGGQQLSSKIALHRVAADGSVMWTKFLPTVWPATSDDFEQTADGNVVILADIENLNTFGRSLVLFKYDPDGNLLWSHEYAPAPTTYGTDLLEMDNGDLVVTGATWPSGPLPDYFLARLDANGNVLYQKIWGDSAQVERLFAVAESPDGGFFLAGAKGPVMNWMLADPGGNVIWTEEFGSSTPWSIRRLDDGYAIAAITHFAGDPYPRVIRTDSAGTVLWEYTETPSTSTPTLMYDILPADGGGLLIAGSVTDSIAPYDEYPYWFMLDDQGQLLWEQSFVVDTLVTQFGAEGHFHDIARMPDGTYTLVGHWGDPFDAVSDEMIILFGGVEPTISTGTPPAVPAAMVFPNPTVGGRFCWQVDASSAPVDIELVSVSGIRRRLLRDQPACGCQAVSDLPEGVYFIEFRQKEIIVGRARLVNRQP